MNEQDIQATQQDNNTQIRTLYSQICFTLHAIQAKQNVIQHIQGLKTSPQYHQNSTQLHRNPSTPTDLINDIAALVRVLDGIRHYNTAIDAILFTTSQQFASIIRRLSQ